MKIIVSGLQEIKPKHRGNVHAHLQLELNVDLEDYDMERIFQGLWEYVGDEGFNKWLKQEGYELRKI